MAANNQNKRGGTSQQHSEPGKKGAEARHNQGGTEQGGSSQRGGTSEQHREAGPKGGEAGGGGNRR